MDKLFRNKKQLLAVAVFLVFVFLMMDLNNRLGELFRLSNERDTIATEYAQLKRTEIVLNTEMAYATSESSVKKWAYEEGHKSLPGDNVVIPLPPADYIPPTPTVVISTPQHVENWEVWKMLFFGK